MRLSSQQWFRPWWPTMTGSKSRLLTLGFLSALVLDLSGGSNPPAFSTAYAEPAPATHKSASVLPFIEDDFAAAHEAAILGESVIIDQGDGVFAVYAHLQPGSAKLAKGARVNAGDTLGKLGSSGNSTEPHLHFQLCDKPGGLSCAGIPPSFSNIDLPFTDGPRPLQSGDVVIAD